VVGPPPAATDSIADARRDYYEFLNSGATKETWNDFLQVHPAGPYANLARAQLAKLIDAEKKAAEEAKAAEQTAIEKAAAERTAAEKKAATEKAVAERAAAEKAEAERIAAEKKAAAEKAAADEAAAEQRAAAAKSEKLTKKMRTASRTPDTEAVNPKPSSLGGNGTWMITWTTQKGANCRGGDSGTYALGVQNGVVTGGKRGSVSSSGAARWTFVGRGGGHLSYTGVLSGNSGSGRFQNSRGCQGTFVARKS
jgi:colicin import membrane protein